MTAAAIECARLTKRYPTGVLALDGINLRIEVGTAFGLVGENGAGKTTFVKLIIGFIFPTAGRLTVLGRSDVARAHPRMGYVHERQFTDLFLTGRQYLGYIAQLSDLWGRAARERVGSLLDLMGLSSSADRRIRTYSKGMLQRLNIAQALLGRPDLVILDEPTAGLDPAEQRDVRDVIALLCRSGASVLLCSHNLPEVEELCDSVGILRLGRLLRAGPIAALRAAPSLCEIVLSISEPAASVAARLGLTDAMAEMRDQIMRTPLSQQVRVLQALLQARVPIRSVNPVEESLEAIYLRETGRRTRDPAADAGSAVVPTSGGGES